MDSCLCGMISACKAKAAATNLRGAGDPTIIVPGATVGCFYFDTSHSPYWVYQKTAAGWVRIGP